MALLLGVRKVGIVECLHDISHAKPLMTVHFLNEISFHR